MKKVIYILGFPVIYFGGLWMGNFNPVLDCVLWGVCIGIIECFNKIKRVENAE